MFTSLLICAVGIALPNISWVREALHFTELPPLYWAFIGGFLLSYAVLTHIVKSWFVRRWGM